MCVQMVAFLCVSAPFTTLHGSEAQMKTIIYSLTAVKAWKRSYVCVNTNVVCCRNLFWDHVFSRQVVLVHIIVFACYCV